MDVNNKWYKKPVTWFIVGLILFTIMMIYIDNDIEKNNDKQLETAAARVCETSIPYMKLCNILYLRESTCVEKYNALKIENGCG